MSKSGGSCDFVIGKNQNGQVSLFEDEKEGDNG